MFASASNHIRSTTVLFVAALICLLLLNFSSSGVIRQPGDDEDSGSGLGGTGRLQVPGSESGLGGTGVRPFLGYEAGAATDNPAEVAILLRPEPHMVPLSAAVSIPADASLPELNKPVPRNINVMNADRLTLDSGAIHITEAIQRNLDTYVLALEPEAQQSEGWIAPQSTAAASAVPVAETSEETQPRITWASLADSMTMNSNTTESLLADEEDDSEANLDRVARPDTVQRPVLPPLQRVRPIQRAGLLPPPVRPLSL